MPGARLRGRLSWPPLVRPGRGPKLTIPNQKPLARLSKFGCFEPPMKICGSAQQFWKPA